MAVACGPRSVAMVCKDGTLCEWDFASDAAVGLDQQSKIRTFSFAPVVQFAMSNNYQKHCVALTVSGTVWTWGFSLFGRLGHDNHMDQVQPREIPRTWFGGSNAAFVSCGVYHTVVTTTVGVVWTFGYGYNGQLGTGVHGIGKVEYHPVCVDTLLGTHIVMAVAGKTHTVAVSLEGKVWTWGSNCDGQLGVHVQEEDTQRDKVLPTPVLGLPYAVASVSASESNTIAVTHNGNMFVWGSNEYGQIGIDSVSLFFKPTMVRLGPDGHEVLMAASSKFNVPGDEPAVAAGHVVLMTASSRFYSIAVTTSGDVWWGGRGSPEDNTHNNHYKSKWTCIPHSLFGTSKIVTASIDGVVNALAVDAEGHVYSWGFGRTPYPWRDTKPEDIPGIPIRLELELESLGFVGPWAVLPRAHTLAFVMGTHHRLGVSTGHLQQLPSELLQRIIETVNGAGVWQQNGVKRLLGGPV